MKYLEFFNFVSDKLKEDVPGEYIFKSKNNNFGFGLLSSFIHNVNINLPYHSFKINGKVRTEKCSSFVSYCDEKDFCVSIGGTSICNYNDIELFVKDIGFDKYYSIESITFDNDIKIIFY